MLAQRQHLSPNVQQYEMAIKGRQQDAVLVHECIIQTLSWKYVYGWFFELLPCSSPDRAAADRTASGLLWLDAAVQAYMSVWDRLSLTSLALGASQPQGGAPRSITSLPITDILPPLNTQES